MKNIFTRKKLSLIYRRKGVSDRIIFGLVFLIFLAYALSIVAIYSFAIITSLKTQNEFTYHPMSFPSKLYFTNYVEAFNLLKVNDTNVIGMLVNSLWFALFCPGIEIFFHLCTSYVLTRYNFKAKKFMYTMIIIWMLLPLYGAGSATYKLIVSLGLKNSYFFVTQFAGGFTGSLFLILAAAWESVDKTYKEASEIDGASQYRIFFQIMLPQVLGAAFALFIMQFIVCWNNYETFLLYLEKMPNLSLGIYEFSQEMTYNPNEPVFFAGVIIASIPILIFFSIFSNKIMDSISFGTGIKG